MYPWTRTYLHTENNRIIIVEIIIGELKIWIHGSFSFHWSPNENILLLIENGAESKGENVLLEVGLRNMPPTTFRLKVPKFFRRELSRPLYL